MPKTNLAAISLMITVSLCSCVTVVMPPTYSKDQPFAIQDVHASASDARKNAPLDAFGPFYLAVLTNPVGMEYTSPERFITTFYHHPRTNTSRGAVGHSWVVLCSEGQFIECGHTGEYGMTEPNYYQGVFSGLKHHEPNPIAYLWHDMMDGRYEPNNGGNKPSCVAVFKLARDEYDAAYKFIDQYQFTKFGLTGPQCSTFVTGVAAAAGIDLGHRVTVNIPQDLIFRGKQFRLWNDPAYSKITYGTPDVLEKSLLLAIQNGLAKDGKEWYRRGSSLEQLEALWKTR